MEEASAAPAAALARAVPPPTDPVQGATATLPMVATLAGAGSSTDMKRQRGITGFLRGTRDAIHLIILGCAQGIHE